MPVYFQLARSNHVSNIVDLAGENQTIFQILSSSCLFQQIWYSSDACDGLLGIRKEIDYIVKVNQLVFPLYRDSMISLPR